MYNFQLFGVAVLRDTVTVVFLNWRKTAETIELQLPLDKII